MTVSAISTFSELADLMEPEWIVEQCKWFSADGRYELILRAKVADNWSMVRDIPGTFAKLSASGSGDTQTIHITLEPKP